MSGSRLGQDALSVESWVAQDEEREELREQLELERTGRLTLIRSLNRVPAFQALRVELFRSIRPDVSVMTIAKDAKGQALDNDPNGRIMANNEGKRSVWYLIHDLLRDTPETYAKEASDASK